MLGRISWVLGGPGLPVSLEEVEHLPLGHGVLAGSLQKGPVVELHYDGVWQFLAVRVRCVRGLEVDKGKLLQGHALVDVHGLGDGELDVARVVNGYDSAFPELSHG